MAMGKRGRKMQESIWVETAELPEGPGHPFYKALNRVLDEGRFDAEIEKTCREFYAPKMGRPSLPPGQYFRCLLIGFFEGIESERGIAWRVADSLALRDFLGLGLKERTPDHSTISGTRRRIGLEAHREVFAWVLRRLAESQLVRGKTLGVDATTLEANAAMKSIVRRDTGESYEEFLKGLAKEAGIETPTRADLARLDRKRPKKGSNDDWKNPNDPDAKITKMKDGRTHFAYKSEHVTDLETTAIIAVKIGPANEGDTASIEDSLDRAQDAMMDVIENADADRHLRSALCQEVVADKGYHSNAVLTSQQERGVRTYISEPDRGRRNWKNKPEEQQATYSNRRRIRGDRGKRLMRLRGERLERTFAHVYDSGGLRRLHVRGQKNVDKRALLATAGYNLSLLMSRVFGFGKPRVLQGLLAALRAILAPNRAHNRLFEALSAALREIRPPSSFLAVSSSDPLIALFPSENPTLSTGC